MGDIAVAWFMFVLVFCYIMWMAFQLISGR